MPKSNFKDTIKISKLIKNEDLHDFTHLENFDTKRREKETRPQTARAAEYRSNLISLIF